MNAVLPTLWIVGRDEAQPGCVGMGAPIGRFRATRERDAQVSAVRDEGAAFNSQPVGGRGALGSASIETKGRAPELGLCYRVDRIDDEGREPNGAVMVDEAELVPVRVGELSFGDLA